MDGAGQVRRWDGENDVEVDEQLDSWQVTGLDGFGFEWLEKRGKEQRSQRKERIKEKKRKKKRRRDKKEEKQRKDGAERKVGRMVEEIRASRGRKEKKRRRGKGSGGPGMMMVMRMASGLCKC